MVAPRPKPRPPPPPYTRPSSSSCDSLAPRGPRNALTQRAKPKALPPREKPRAPQRKPPPPSCSPPPTHPPCSPPPNTPRRAPSRGRNLERTAHTRHANSADRRTNLDWTRRLSHDCLCIFAPEVAPLLSCIDGQWLFTDGRSPPPDSSGYEVTLSRSESRLSVPSSVDA